MSGGSKMWKFAGMIWASLVLATGGLVCAQDAGAEAKINGGKISAGVVVPTEESAKKAHELERKLPKPVVESKEDFELSEARQERFKKFLPRAWNTLSQRESFTILALGDGVFDLWSGEEDDKGAMALAFPGAFAQELANQFFYTGGVVEIGKGGSGAGAAKKVLGPAIGLRQMSRVGGSVLDAARILESSGRQTKVDVVLLCYGQHEAAMGMSPVTFAHAIQEALDEAKKIDAEVILCGPWLEAAERSELTMGTTRPLNDVLREVGEQEGVLYVDLGDLARLMVDDTVRADEGRVFAALERTYKAFFHAEPNGRYVPRAKLHGLLGQMMFRKLLDGPPALPWKAVAAKATQLESGSLSLEFTVENGAEKPVELAVLPLIAGGWKPLATNPIIKLDAGAKQVVEVQYAKADEGGIFPEQEAVVRLPVLIAGEGKARVMDLRAPVQPVAIVWALETLFNQEKTFTVGCQLVNRSGKQAKGSWQVEFNGAKLAGQYDLRVEATQPLDLRFDLPEGGPAAQVLPLSLTVKGDDGVNLKSQRQVEIVRNVGLGGAVPLRAVAVNGTEEGVAMRASADKKGLTLVCTVANAELLNNPPADGSPAWQLEVNLDARSYGKRLERGSTAAVLVTGSGGDGPGVVHEVAPWSFGNEYAAVFDAKEFAAALSSARDGKRQISLTIPRTYLYLHEWALKNGNSQFGINVRLTFHQAPIGGAAKFTTYSLTLNSKPVNDVESLAVLELTEEPTKRVTVTVY